MGATRVRRKTRQAANAADDFLCPAAGNAAIKSARPNPEKFESCKLERSAVGEAAAAAEDEAATMMATMVAAMLKDRKGS